MTAIRAAAPRLPQRPVTAAKPAAAVAAPAQAPARQPVMPVKAQGGFELGGKIVGGIAGGVGGVMGGSAVGLLAHLFMGAAGNPVTAVIPICAIGFGALCAWGGARNGAAIGQLIEGFFGKN